MGIIRILCATPCAGKFACFGHAIFPDNVANLSAMRGVVQPAAGSLDREAYRQQRLEQLSAQGLPYGEYLRRYREVMAD